MEIQLQKFSLGELPSERKVLLNKSHFNKRRDETKRNVMKRRDKMSRTGDMNLMRIATDSLIQLSRNEPNPG